MILCVRTVTVLWLAIVAYDYCRPVNGSADQFQCACAYNARKHVHNLRTMIEDGRDEDAVVRSTAEYGALVSRMLFVAHSGPEPTARWLWQLHLFANTTHSGRSSSASPARMLLKCLDRVRTELDDYAKICGARRLNTGTGWSQQTFEKYVLENVTSIVQNSEDVDRVRETDFEPRLLYLNDVAADGGGRLSELLTERVDVDWKDTADRLSRLYESSVRKRVLGTRELVLYQKTFVSTVAASVMGYVLIHVTHCQRHWSSHFRDGDVAIGSGTDNDNNGLVGEYERVWMSVGGLLEKFKSYLALGPEKYIKTLMDIAGNPVWDDDRFGRVTRTIETNIAEIGRGSFAVKTTGVRVTDDDEQTLAAATLPAAAKEKPFIELVALVDNNINAAETYLKLVQRQLSDVDFRVINDFMRSTHIWLT